jgi:hypothetical protein
MPSSRLTAEKSMYVAETAAIILVSLGNQSLKMFLQVRKVDFLGFAFFVRVILSGVALDFFVHTFVA